MITGSNGIAVYCYIIQWGSGEMVISGNRIDTGIIKIAFASLNIDIEPRNMAFYTRYIDIGLKTM